MNPSVKLCVWVYRRLARAFPHEFWMNYGEDLERMGEDAAPEIWRRHGFFGLVKLIADIAVRLLLEYLTEFRQDAVYAARTLTKSPGITAVAITSLSLGMGVCVTFFAQIEWMMRPIPVALDPQALVAIEEPVSYPLFERYRDHSGVAQSTMAFMGPVPFGVAVEGLRGAKGERIFGHIVSPEYFSTLGVNPAAGRFFNPETEKPGAAPVVVISDRFWHTRMDSDPHAVGRALRVNGTSATIVGVGPKDFSGVWPSSAAELFVPVTAGISPELADNALQRSDARIFHVVFRADPAAQAATEAAVNTIKRTFDVESGAAKPDDKERHVGLILAGGVMPLTSGQRAASYGASIILGGLVLLLAYANLANLVIARGSERRKEIAIRLSIGASRFRLLRQSLTESLMLSLAGAIGALIFAHFLLRFFITLAGSATDEAAIELGYRVDLQSFMFAIAIAALSCAGFGLAPALASTRTDLTMALKEGAVTPLRGYKRFGIRNLFVAGQVAASLTMLLLTSYIVVGYEKTTRIAPGFDTAGLYMFQLDPVRNGYSEEQAAAVFEKLPERLAGTGKTTLAETAPLNDLMITPNIRVEALAHRGETQKVLVTVAQRRIGARYFNTLDVPLMRGGEFSERDVRGKASLTVSPPVILNQTAARDLFAGDDPIGRTIQEGKQDYTVIGVVRDMKSAVLLANPVPTIYVPMSVSSGATVILRGAPGSDLMAGVRKELAAMDPGLTIFNVRSMRNSIEQLNGFIRIGSAFYLGMGVFGLILASIGLAGVTAYTVARRRKEIGIRLALGARNGHVIRLVLREGASLVAVGSVIGFAAAFAASRVLATTTETLARSFAIAAGDPRLVIGAPLLLVAIAMAACYIPARRSTRIAPLTALRDM